jgi:hypothetical protein
MAGYRVCYTLAARLINELVDADDKQLTKTINRYSRRERPVSRSPPTSSSLKRTCSHEPV